MANSNLKQIKLEKLMLLEYQKCVSVGQKSNINR